MRLCRFLADGEARLGLIEDGRLIDLTASAPELPTEPAAAIDAVGIDRLAELAELAAEPSPGEPLEAIRLLSPARPRKYLAIALNYADHIAETGMEAPQVPTFFNKQPTCVVGPEPTSTCPTVSDKLDYEGELAIVIGKRCRHVARRAGRRGDRRLHDRQRRLGPRLADAGADDDDRQVVRHPRPARALARHRR